LGCSLLGHGASSWRCNPCQDFLARLRWPKVDGPSAAADWASGRGPAVKVGTIFEDSPIALDKWLPALWMLVNDKNGISSYEMARALGVTQKTAWFMGHRLRLAMQRGSIVKLRGEVEVDETFIGGSARFMHKGKCAAKIKGGTGVVGKVASWACWNGTGRTGIAP